MTEKHEALKGKIFLIQDTFDGELVLVKTVRLIDLKSAVQGLLEEIKREKERYKENKQVVSGLCITEELIKKWFADVVSEDD